MYELSENNDTDIPTHTSSSSSLLFSRNGPSAILRSLLDFVGKKTSPSREMMSTAASDGLTDQHGDDWRRVSAGSKAWRAGDRQHLPSLRTAALTAPQTPRMSQAEISFATLPPTRDQPPHPRDSASLGPRDAGCNSRRHVGSARSHATVAVSTPVATGCRAHDGVGRR